MKIAVCVDTGFISQHMNVTHISKAIQAPNEDLDTVIEGSSIAALQLALSLSKKGDTVTAVSYGGSTNVAALEYALAFGVTSVVHIAADENIANPADPQGVASALSEWLKEQSFDIIICGNPSGTGLVPSLIAGYLDIPSVPRVYEASQSNAGELELYQRLDRGWRQRATAKLPAVLTVQDGYFANKYVSVRQRRVASQKLATEMQVVNSSQSDGDNMALQGVAAPRTRAKRTAIAASTSSASDRLKSLVGGIGGAAKPAAKKEEKDDGIIETTADKAADKIISFLEEKELLPEKLSK